MKSALFARLWRRGLSQATHAFRQAWHAGAAAPSKSAASLAEGTYTDERGSVRGYKLFVPAHGTWGAAPLLVMLHGCVQDAEDLARGTRMNALAEQRGWLVLYPEQSPRFNKARCWNWFLPENQRRGGGEAALVAGMTKQVMQQHAVDETRIYVAGMSAGGAMAAILGREYPDLFAAAGVHSGLAPGTAHNIASAMRVMENGEPSLRARKEWTPKPAVPTIVFQGDADRIVHPRNARQLVDDLLSAPAKVEAPRTQEGEEAGRHFTRSTWHDASGLARIELWQLRGTGHGWSGGDPAGSSIDANGPDASREMLRFFEQHRRRVVA